MESFCPDHDQRQLLTRNSCFWSIESFCQDHDQEEQVDECFDMAHADGRKMGLTGRNGFQHHVCCMAVLGLEESSGGHWQDHICCMALEDSKHESQAHLSALTLRNSREIRVR